MPEEARTTRRLAILLSMATLPTSTSALAMSGLLAAVIAVVALRGLSSERKRGGEVVPRRRWPASYGRGGDCGRSDRGASEKRSGSWPMPSRWPSANPGDGVGGG